MIKVAIIGANGYTGLELMKILAHHKHAKLVTAVSRSNAGTKIADMYPILAPYTGEMCFSELDEKEIAATCDVAFTALPHAASAEIGGKLSALNVKVIDLSADFRYNDIELYEKTYKVTHPCPEKNAEAVYGLCELFKDDIKKANIIGNPGCYTTAAIMPLYPLLKEGLIEKDDIIINAASGATGAGRKSETAYTLTESCENFKAYGVTTHRHTSEIEEKLSSAAGSNIALTFTPHLLPVKRGILETIYAKTTATKEQIAAAYEKYYKNEKFVEVLKEGSLPELNHVVRSNRIAIGFKMDTRLNRIIIVSCLDNLLKGASGQAIQNMNIMFNLEETEGLPLIASYL